MSDCCHAHMSQQKMTTVGNVGTHAAATACKAEEVGICLAQESFWRFKIPEHKLDIAVLVVGHVSEPKVAFDRPGLSFGKVLVGGRTHATINLVNSEHMPFQFELNKASYDASPALLSSTGLPLPQCVSAA